MTFLRSARNTKLLIILKLSVEMRSVISGVNYILNNNFCKKKCIIYL